MASINSGGLAPGQSYDMISRSDWDYAIALNNGSIPADWIDDQPGVGVSLDVWVDYASRASADQFYEASIYANEEPEQLALHIAMFSKGTYTNGLAEGFFQDISRLYLADPDGHYSGDKNGRDIMTGVLSGILEDGGLEGSEGSDYFDAYRHLRILGGSLRAAAFRDSFPEMVLGGIGPSTGSRSAARISQREASTEELAYIRTTLKQVVPNYKMGPNDGPQLSKVMGPNDGPQLQTGGMPAHLRAGQIHEDVVLQQNNLNKNNSVWRPDQENFDSAAFQVIVGEPKYTKGGIPKGTIFDSTDNGYLEIKGGKSQLSSSYQLRLQTYKSLQDDVPYTISTTRPVSPSFQEWLDRWGVNVVKPK